MADEEEKIARIDMGHNPGSIEILAAIHKAQDDWALENPQRAHEKYPTVWDENGKRIKKD